MVSILMIWFGRLVLCESVCLIDCVEDVIVVLMMMEKKKTDIEGGSWDL